MINLMISSPHQSRLKFFWFLDIYDKISGQVVRVVMVVVIKSTLNKNTKQSLLVVIVLLRYLSRTHATIAATLSVLFLLSLCFYHSCVRHSHHSQPQHVDTCPPLQQQLQLSSPVPPLTSKISPRYRLMLYSICTGGSCFFSLLSDYKMLYNMIPPPIIFQQ